MFCITQIDKRMYGSTLDRTNKCYSTEKKCIFRVIKYESTINEYLIITNKCSIEMNDKSI